MKRVGLFSYRAGHQYGVFVYAHIFSIVFITVIKFFSKMLVSGQQNNCLICSAYNLIFNAVDNREAVVESGNKAAYDFYMGHTIWDFYCDVAYSYLNLIDSGVDTIGRKTEHIRMQQT